MTLSTTDLHQYLALSDSDFEQSQMNATVYENFKRCLFTDGEIAWRESTESRQVVIMNDYNSETGDFKVSEVLWRIFQSKNCLQ